MPNNKLDLYNKAKEAYYNGEEIMSDYEFDSLEKELGLENKAYVGAKHNPAYTVQHPYIMGSLSKVQIHKSKEGVIEWPEYYDKVRSFIKGDCVSNVIITPKYDGCSFEAYVKDGECVISSRGDGYYGKDFTEHILRHIPACLLSLGGCYTLRGEVLVSKETFKQKYTDQFSSPRSFVSGVLNTDYDEEDEELQRRINDLELVVYDYRVKEDGVWQDYDFTALYNINIKPYDTQSPGFTQSPILVLPDFYIDNIELNDSTFSFVYDTFDDYRKDARYALDGFVIKPKAPYRENNITEARPKDCVAIKFVPMLQPTEVVNITWSLGKTHELTPIIWVKPVEMDGRMVQKCSGHNYGLLKEKGVTIGSKIVMSLAGDIIPFLYKVAEENKEGAIPMPEEYEVYEDGVHLMAALSEEEIAKVKFLNSAATLNIPGIGSETAKKIFEYITRHDDITDNFFGAEEKPLKNNILTINPEDVYLGAGAGKTGQKAQKEFKNIIKTLSLADVIKSLNFKFCGKRVAEQCAKQLLTGNGSFEHLAAEGYEWVFDKESAKMRELNSVLESLGKDIDDFKAIESAREEESNQIPVILTGEPNGYRSKGEFLKLNPQYRVTGSWKEAQIVFTNSLDSNTGKMKKAREKNIEIRIY